MRLRSAVTVGLSATVLLTACANPGDMRPGAPAVSPAPGVNQSDSADGSSGSAGSRIPGSDAPAGPGGTTFPVSVADALARWATFPVNVSPRPLVLLGDAVQAPAAGFASDAAKEAFSSGDVVLDATLPTAPRTVGGYPVNAAATAFTQLKGVGGATSTTSVPLHITGVTLGQATFSTDRGPQQLPSWEFRFAGVGDPAQVLAVAASARWVPDGSAVAQVAQAASVGGDGRMVTVSFAGVPVGPPPCGIPADGYVATADETATAALITVSAVATPQPSIQNGGAGVACPAIAQQRTVTLALKAPLGARVLLDSTGSPYSVQ